MMQSTIASLRRKKTSRTLLDERQRCRGRVYSIRVQRLGIAVQCSFDVRNLGQNVLQRGNLPEDHP